MVVNHLSRLLCFLKCFSNRFLNISLWLLLFYVIVQLISWCNRTKRLWGSQNCILIPLGVVLGLVVVADIVDWPDEGGLYAVSVKIIDIFGNMQLIRIHHIKFHLSFFIFRLVMISCLCVSRWQTRMLQKVVMISVCIVKWIKNTPVI